MVTSSIFRPMVITDPKAIKMLRKANRRPRENKYEHIDLEAEQQKAVEILKRKFSL
ncbi:MAG: hypothetical protein LBI71_08075 [Enterobacteriaceae bacterium]|jgi:hypothetical protein|nr:hypothetical protein [Enterobacteriaceae bacterium]